GLPYCAGTASTASGMRSATSCRARYSGVSSENTTVTSETPYFDSERTCMVRGSPAMARSTGIVTYCSISIGDSAREDVMICTWTWVRGGTASMGSRSAAGTPSTTKSTAASSTTSRLRKDSWRMPRSSSISGLFAERALEQRALQGKDPFYDHLLAGAQPGQ